MMRKPAHLLTLAAGVVVAAAVTVTVPAAAEEHFPAPTMAEQHGKIVRDEPAALRVEDMPELQDRAVWDRAQESDLPPVFWATGKASPARVGAVAGGAR